MTCDPFTGECIVSIVLLFRRFEAKTNLKCSIPNSHLWAKRNYRETLITTENYHIYFSYYQCCSEHFFNRAASMTHKGLTVKSVHLVTMETLRLAPRMPVSSVPAPWTCHPIISPGAV